MTGNAFIDAGIGLALIVLVILMGGTAYRVFRGPQPADRLQAIDAMTTLLIAVIIVSALVQNLPSLIDVGIALALFSFVATLAIARYLSEGRVF